MSTEQALRAALERIRDYTLLVLKSTSSGMAGPLWATEIYAFAHNALAAAPEQPAAPTCPACNAATTEAQETETFNVGHQNAPVKVTATFPVYTCIEPQCAERFCNWRAEEAKSEATIAALSKALLDMTEQHDRLAATQPAAPSQPVEDWTDEEVDRAIEAWEDNDATSDSRRENDRGDMRAALKSINAVRAPRRTPTRHETGETKNDVG